MHNQDKNYFDTLYLENYRKLLIFVYRLLQDRYFAEEIVQDTFVVAYKKIAIIQKHENPVGWLYITAKNISKAYLREIKRLKLHVPLWETDQAVTCEGSLSSKLSDYLTKEETEILVRFYEYRQSIKEISAHYHINESACKMRLKRARGKVKKKIKEIFY